MANITGTRIAAGSCLASLLLLEEKELLTSSVDTFSVSNIISEQNFCLSEAVIIRIGWSEMFAFLASFYCQFAWKTMFIYDKDYH
ncbi:hypothetical protein T11_6803 [Trichinella zimbabwensis]|uniref:Uncharacterized protein n=1 Tax=Trichinella zimbabwensis TaxID=268475 RepID=A0A0V1HMC7_9BILA|nr:hypothetical protein T11_6803 [Trichinella zimbabwensis]